MRKFYMNVLLLGLIAGCASVPKKKFDPVQLVGSWRLLRTIHNGVVRLHRQGTLKYRFTPDGGLVSSIGSKVFRGRWRLKGDRLFAWWPGRHRESHKVVEISPKSLSLLSRDGRLLSVFRRER